jgi:hypothetical protein
MSYDHFESPIIWEQDRSAERDGESQWHNGVFCSVMCECLLIFCC